MRGPTTCPRAPWRLLWELRETQRVRNPWGLCIAHKCIQTYCFALPPLLPVATCAARLRMSTTQLEAFEGSSLQGMLDAGGEVFCKNSWHQVSTVKQLVTSAPPQVLRRMSGLQTLRHQPSSWSLARSSWKQSLLWSRVQYCSPLHSIELCFLLGDACLKLTGERFNPHILPSSRHSSSNYWKRWCQALGESHIQVTLQLNEPCTQKVCH